ncbi:MAG TPA: LapA family protein [Methylophilaceae bacterium]|nr:LapA family protein [Methylophilaceae bacterium]
MRYVYLTLVFLLFVLLLGFALKNAEIVELHYYLGFIWRAPLSLMLLIAFFFGTVAGMIACLNPLIRQRRQLIAMQRELRQLDPHTQAAARGTTATGH